MKNISQLIVVVVGIWFATHAHGGGGEFMWAKSMGGTNYTMGLSLAIDGFGNTYTTGNFSGITDFDPGPGVTNLTSQSQGDIFVSKMDRNGRFVWAKAMSGNSYSSGNGIALDRSGNVYITGHFMGTVDFDPGPDIYNKTSEGIRDIFVSKLNSNGDFVWVKTMGGTSSDEGLGIVVDTSGEIYTTGYFALTADFDPGPEVYNLTSAGSYDAFVSKLDGNGNFIWAAKAGSTWADSGTDIAVDASGNVYTTGSITPLGESEYIFVTKQDSSGDRTWAKIMGGTGYAAAYGIAVDPPGNVYTTGYFSETVDFDPGGGVANISSLGPEDIFISKLDSNGEYVWAKNMGGTSSDYGNSIAIDNLGFVYITGGFEDTLYFFPESLIPNLTSEGIRDIFVSKLDSDGSFVWAKAVGGTLDDGANDIAIGQLSSVHTTGWFKGTVDFDPGPGTYSLVSNENKINTFILKLDGSESFPWPMFLPAITNGASP